VVARKSIKNVVYTRFDEAEEACNDLNKRYPDMVNSIERQAMLYEARGENEKAAEYYSKTAEFMQSNPGFEKEGVQWVLDKVKQLKEIIGKAE